jgi:hypothetical protein
MGMNFTLIKQYIEQLTLEGDILEIGSNRGEGSTTILGQVALHNNRVLYSVDMDSMLIDGNKNFNNSASEILPIQFYNMKGEDFLKQNKHLKFSVVLLDNFDWDSCAGLPNTSQDWMKIIMDQKAMYLRLIDTDMTNLNSQMTHLEQAMLCIELLTDNSVIICDDTYRRVDGTYDGKCGAAVPYLMLHGFEVIHSDGLGTILSRRK